MAAKIFRTLVLAIFIVIPLTFFYAEPPALSPASADAVTADQSRGDKDGSSVGYYFDTDENGNSVFTQILSWDEDPYALRFEIIIRDSLGAEILRKTTESSSIKVQLAPDSYTYDIITWNLLNQPEIESGWQPLVVIKAELPKITSLTPGYIYMDNPENKIVIKGEKLLPGVAIFLHDASGRDIIGSELARTDETDITVTFPEKEFKPGAYDIVAVNPGGLKAAQKDAIKIRFQRPVDILVSAGYSPISFFQDSWFRANWNKPMYWLGANGNLSVYFVKKEWGFLGGEAFGTGYKLSGGLDLAGITSEYLLLGANFLYKYRFDKTISAIARAGGGVANSHHSFDYRGVAGPELNASNIFLDMGLSAQYIFPFKMFIELGAAWYEIFGTGYTAGGLSPTLRVGYQIF